MPQPHRVRLGDVLQDEVDVSVEGFHVGVSHASHAGRVPGHHAHSQLIVESLDQDVQRPAPVSGKVGNLPEQRLALGELLRLSLELGGAVLGQRGGKVRRLAASVQLPVGIYPVRVVLGVVLRVVYLKGACLMKPIL